MQDEQSSGPSWILAFDASCSACSSVSAVVHDASEGTLRTLPLADAQVREWLGPQAPWAPTLLRVEGNQVRAWTGPALGVRLVRMLGARMTLRTVRGLGRLRQRTDRSGVQRRRPVNQLAIGVFVVMGVLLAGRLMVSPDNWVRDNRGRLPRTYEEIITHPVPYRRAILAEMPAAERSALWAEHIRRSREQLTELSTAQVAVLDQGAELLGNASFFEAPKHAEHDRRAAQLKQEATEAFGKETAGALFATFGPGDPDVSAYCSCSTYDDYCYWWSGCVENKDNCDKQVTGCGTGYDYPCDGRCK